MAVWLSSPRGNRSHWRSRRSFSGESMALTLESTEPNPKSDSPHAGERIPTRRAAWIGAAGIASLGAGAIHAAAIGVHAEHRPTAIAFTVLAVLQLAWGGVALVRSGRVVATLGVLLGLGAFAGW